MEMSEKRMEICRACPLFEIDGEFSICCNTKYINKDEEWSYIKKKGYVRGCGCKLEYKTKNPMAHCVINK